MRAQCAHAFSGAGLNFEEIRDAHRLTGDARLEFLRNENGARGPVGYQPTTHRPSIVQPRAHARLTGLTNARLTCLTNYKSYIRKNFLFCTIDYRDGFALTRALRARPLEVALQGRARSVVKHLVISGEMDNREEVSQILNCIITCKLARRDATLPGLPRAARSCQTLSGPLPRPTGAVFSMKIYLNSKIGRNSPNQVLTHAARAAAKKAAFSATSGGRARRARRALVRARPQRKASAVLWAFCQIKAN